MSNKAVCRPKDKRKDEILRGYEYQMELAVSLQNDLEKLMTGATKMTNTITDMPRGGDCMDIGDHIIEWMPLQEEINHEILKCVEERRKILKYLDTVKNPKLRQVLQLNYIECITQEEIAERMHYSSTQWVRELINKAVEQVKI